jgi:uncharacterized protein YcbX
MTTGTLAGIFRYPVKSLGGEALEEAVLAPGRGLAGDRAYALVPAGVDAHAPGWRPKSRCLALVRHAALARFAARLDEAGGVLAIDENGAVVVRGRPSDPADRARIEAALARRLPAELEAVALAAAGPDAMLSDVDVPLVSVVNLASVRALGAALGAEVAPLRFRANLYIEGLPGWCERGWAGRRASLGGAVLEFIEPVIRCAATEVNPVGAARDLHVLRGLADGFGHAEMGVYAKVVAGGCARRGEALALLGS